MMENHKAQSSAPDVFPCLSFDELLAFSSKNISSSRKNELENHLAHCSLCSDAIEGIANVADRDQIRPIIRSLSDSVHRRTTQLTDKQRNWKIYYRVAAVLFIAFSVSLYLLNQKPQHEILFATYFKPYPNIIPITRGESAEIMLKRGLAEYEFENYEQAVMILEDVIKSEPANAAAHFYLGVSLLCLNRSDQAIRNFQAVLQMDNNEFSGQAQWYLGLAHLRKGELDQAKLILQNLQSEHPRNEQQVKELLNSIEKLSVD